jgi:acetyl-CoA carboxylase biotin carboxyl carrier protein
MTDETMLPGQAPSTAGPVDVADAADAAGAAPVAETAGSEAEAPAGPRGGGDLELLSLIDRLAALLDRSDLTELEVEAGGTGLVLRKPSALVPIAIAGPGSAAAGTAASAEVAPSAAGEPPTAGRDPAATAKPSVKAPLTGIFYASPAPGSAPYVTAGGEVAVGQIVGLIEAMKLFNEIRSTAGGKVKRIFAENGQLVRAHQPLLELEPI